MDLVSIGNEDAVIYIHRLYILYTTETEWENRLLSRKMSQVGAVSVWTSGHVCDGTCVGWWWTGSGMVMTGSVQCQVRGYHLPTPLI